MVLMMLMGFWENFITTISWSSLAPLAPLANFFCSKIFYESVISNLFQIIKLFPIEQKNNFNIVDFVFKICNPLTPIWDHCAQVEMYWTLAWLSNTLISEI